MSRQYENKGRDQINVEHLKGDFQLGDRYNAQHQVPVPELDTLPPVKFAAAQWVDRPATQAALLQRLAATPMTEIVAAGGFGKTTLALWAYAQLQPQYDRALWVGFNGDKPLTFNQFACGLLAEIGFLVDPRTQEEALVTQLTVRLAGKPCLLVLDQVEVLEPTPDWPWFKQFLQDWQRRGQTSTVLATTRRPVLGDDQSWRLPGLSTPEGITFLAQQQGLAAEHLADLVALAQGHPLLLKLAAGWVKQVYGARVDGAALDFFARLFAHYQGNPEAQVEEIFATLFRALPESWQTLLQGVSVYRDVFDLTAAQAMLPAVTAADLHSLVERAFLQPQGERWTLHPLMQALVRDQLGRGEAWQQAQEQAAAYFAGCIVPWDGTLASCGAELEIVYHRCELGQYAAAKQVMDTCEEFLSRRGYARELVPVYERLTHEWQAQAPTDETDQQNLGGAWITLGNRYDNLAQYQAAIAAHTQAQTLFAQIEFTQGIAAALGGLGNAYQSLGQYQRAIDCQQQSLEIKREIGDRQGEASSLGNLGGVYQSLGQYQRAIDCQQQSLEIEREIGNRQGEANSLGNLGIAYKSLGQYQRAIDFYQQHHDIACEIGDRKGEANSLGGLGNAYSSLGQHQRAIDYHQQSLEIKRAIGDRKGEANSLWSLSNLYKQRGRFKRARSYRLQAYRLWQVLDLPLAALPLPDLTKRILKHVGDDWVDQQIASEQSLGWLLDALGLINLVIRWLFAPVGWLRQRLRRPR
jgi:tetratricopeptide (TPR) repeat protein